MYELLHMQLWRKGKCRLQDGINVTIDGVEYGAIKEYDIKSSSKKPYNRYTHDYGLNQLFVGGNPYKHYDAQDLPDLDGDHGIHHDDCKIVLKNNFRFSFALLGNKNRGKDELLDDIPLSIPMPGWQWGTAYNQTQGWTAFYKIRMYDGWGEKLIDNVEQIDITDENNETKRYAHIFYTNGNDGYIEMQKVEYGIINPSTIMPVLEYKEKLNSAIATVNYRVGSHQSQKEVETYEGYVPIPMYIEKFGEPLHILENIQMSTSNIWGMTAGRVYVFPRGITFFLSPSKMRDDTDQEYNIHPISYPGADEEISEEILDETFGSGGNRYFLPLVNKQTGRTLASKIVFIDYWDSIFELYVHEDTEWYKIVIAMIVIVVAAIITYFFPPFGIAAKSAIAAVLAMGVFIGGIGALSGNKWLQAIGMVMTLGASIYGGAQSVAIQGAMEAGKGVLTQAAMQEAARVGIMQMLQYAFAEMPLEMFLQIFSLYNTLSAPTPEMPSQQRQNEESNRPQVQFMISANEQIDEVMMISKAHDDVMNMVKI
jgi:hypothetical protein